VASRSAPPIAGAPGCAEGDTAAGARPVGAADVRAFVRRSAASEARAVEARRAFLRSLLAPAARLLAARGAQRVWVVGSLAWGGLHPGSDLDLAVAGLPPERWGDARAALWELAGEPVDLIPLEAAAETLRVRILETGEELPLEPHGTNGAGERLAPSPAGAGTLAPRGADVEPS